MFPAERFQLRRTQPEDLHTLFTFQLDAEANRMAAFTAKDPADKDAYIRKYTPFLTDPTIHMCTLFVDGHIAGSIAKFEMAGEAGITYWIDRGYWGQGLASTALLRFLAMEKARPIFGHVAFDNIGSQRVLEKCGFVRTGSDRGFAAARGEEIEELIYKLD